eukprot:COSAG01_NODE_13082_length_1637_cov_1.866797_1_plen_418_part_10
MQQRANRQTRPARRTRPEVPRVWPRQTPWPGLLHTVMAGHVGALRCQFGGKGDFVPLWAEVKAEVLQLKARREDARPLATAMVAGCHVARTKKARKGHPHSVRVDLAVADSRGCTKYVLSFEDARRLKYWSSVLTQGEEEKRASLRSSLRQSFSRVGGSSGTVLQAAGGTPGPTFSVAMGAVGGASMAPAEPDLCGHMVRHDMLTSGFPLRVSKPSSEVGGRGWPQECQFGSERHAFERYWVELAEGQLCFREMQHATVPSRVAAVSGAVTSDPKSARKGQLWALRLDLLAPDSCGDTKYVQPPAVPPAPHSRHGQNECRGAPIISRTRGVLLTCGLLVCAWLRAGTCCLLRLRRSMTSGRSSSQCTRGGEPLPSRACLRSLEPDSRRRLRPSPRRQQRRGGAGAQPPHHGRARDFVL